MVTHQPCPSHPIKRIVHRRSHSPPPPCHNESVHQLRQYSLRCSSGRWISNSQASHRSCRGTLQESHKQSKQLDVNRNHHHIDESTSTQFCAVTPRLCPIVLTLDRLANDCLNFVVCAGIVCTDCSGCPGTFTF